MTDREVAEGAYAALARDDLAAFLSLIHPDVEFTSLIAEVEGTTYRGHAGVREWWATVKIALGGLKWDVEEIREVSPDQILVRFQLVGTLAGDPLAQRMFTAVESRAGLIGSWAVFRTEAEALQALADGR